MILVAHLQPAFYVLATTASGGVFATIGPYLRREDASEAARRDRLVHYRIEERKRPVDPPAWRGSVPEYDEAA